MSRYCLSSSAGALFGAFTLMGTCAAHAESCDTAIARWEGIVARAQAERTPALDAPESTAATLHHQPTAASVGQAESAVNAKAEAALDRAKKLRATGKTAECVRTLDRLNDESGAD